MFNFQGKYETVKIVCLPDVHIPETNIFSLNHALTFIENYKPEIVIFNGDLFDFGQISSFVPDTRTHFQRRAEMDFGTLIGILRYIVDDLKTSGVEHIIFMPGNHEYRLLKKSLETDTGYDLFAIFENDLSSLGIHFVGREQLLDGHWLVLNEELAVGHGFGTSIDSLVRRVFPRVVTNRRSLIGYNLMFGHFHVGEIRSYHVRDKMFKICCAPGLFHPVPHYVRTKPYYPSWENGFGVIEFSRRGSSVYNSIDIVRIETPDEYTTESYYKATLTSVKNSDLRLGVKGLQMVHNANDIYSQISIQKETKGSGNNEKPSVFRVSINMARDNAIENIKKRALNHTKKRQNGYAEVFRNSENVFVLEGNAQRIDNLMQNARYEIIFNHKRQCIKSVTDKLGKTREQYIDELAAGLEQDQIMLLFVTRKGLTSIKIVQFL